MVLTSEIIRSVQGEADAQAVYREVCKSGDFVGFLLHFGVISFPQIPHRAA